MAKYNWQTMGTRPETKAERKATARNWSNCQRSPRSARGDGFNMLNYAGVCRREFADKIACRHYIAGARMYLRNIQQWQRLPR